MVEEVEDDWDRDFSHPIYPKTCHNWIQENSKYYIEVLKTVRPYIEDFISVLESEGAETYYSRGEIHNKKELQELFELLINETYGHNG